MWPRQLAARTEALLPTPAHVELGQEVDILGERPRRIFVTFLGSPGCRRSGSRPRDLLRRAAANRTSSPLPISSRPAAAGVFVRLDGAYDDLEKPRDPQSWPCGHSFEASRHRRFATRL